MGLGSYGSSLRRRDPGQRSHGRSAAMDWALWWVCSAGRMVMENLGLGFSFHLGFWLKFMELILSFLIDCIRFLVIESQIEG